MSRQISPRYLLFYWFVSAILVCGSSRRIPREASCPSCSQDCPEGLTVQLPWNSYEESNLQDFSFNPPRHSPYSRLTQERISEDTAHDDNILMSQNSMSLGNNRRFPQQEPASKNFFFKNYLNNSPKPLDRQEIFSQDKPARKYPLVLPSRQVFDRAENLFFRNPRNKYSESLSEDYKRTKDYKKIEEDPTSKVLIMNRADRDTKPSWENSRDTSNIIQSDKFFPNVENIYRSRREEVLDKETNAIKKSSNSASQLRYPRERYNPIGLLSDVKRSPYVKDIDISKSTKEFFDWDKDSLQSSNLEQLRNNLLEVHPAKKPEIIAKNDNEKINFNFYNSKFPQDLNTKESEKDEKSLDMNPPIRPNTRFYEHQDDEDMKDYFDDEAEYLMNEKDMKEYFEDETDQDTIETKRDNYNPHVLPQNIRNIKNEELFDLNSDDLSFMHKNSQKTGQSGLYSKENNKYFQDKPNEDMIFQDETYTSAEAVRAPVINAYNAYILPRYLNIVNDKKSPAKFETQELSEAKNSIRANSVKEMNQRFFEDEDVIENNTRIQDFILPKNIFDVDEYNSPIADKQNNVRNKNEVPIELDPDLLDDIEDPPIGTTESTPK